MEKDRSDFAVMNRMIDHIRLLIAVDDETIPVKKKLETQALLKDFQTLLSVPEEQQERGRHVESVDNLGRHRNQGVISSS